MDRVRVLCWSELTEPKEVYPNGISGALAEYLTTQSGIEARTASINDPDQGLASQLLEATDVLVWWGHKKHGDVLFNRVAEVVKRVKSGKLGFIALHSAHYSKLLKSVLDCPGDLGSWRNGAGKERLRVVAPFHPIAKGISDFTIPETEMYGEPFQLPPPERVVFFSLGRLSFLTLRVHLDCFVTAHSLIGARRRVSAEVERIGTCPWAE